MSARLLVVDDMERDRDDILWTLETKEKERGYTITTADSEDHAVEILASNSFDVVITDMRMERIEGGLEVLEAVKKGDPTTQVIVLTAYGTTDNAVKAMMLGAFEYVEKGNPDLDIFELLPLKVERALELTRALRELRDPR